MYLTISPSFTIKKRCVDEICSLRLKGFQRFTLSQKDIEPQKLLNEINSLTLFSQKKVIILQDLHELNAKRIKEILPILKRKLQSIEIIILSNKEVLKDIRTLSYDKVYDYSNKKIDELVREELELYGLNKSQKKIIDLLSSTGLSENGEYNFDLIAKNIEILSLYLGNVDGKIDSLSEDNILHLFSSNTQQSDFEFIDKLIAKDTVNSKILLRKLLENNKNSFLLLSLLNRTVLNLLQVRRCLDLKYNLEQIKEKTNQQGWILNKNIETAKKTSYRDLSDIVRKISRIDYLLKSKNLGHEAIFDTVEFS